MSMALQPGISERPLRAARSQRGFFAISASIFTAGAALTILRSSSMAKMGAMPMLGGWIVMMVAMMQPALTQTLWHYRVSVAEAGEMSRDRLTVLIAAAYYLAWTVVGAAIYPLGAGITALEIRLPEVARAAPVMIGAVVVLAGALQFTEWKAKRLACCRQWPQCDTTLPTDARAAWSYGLRLGLHCIGCCINFVMILLSIGVMDLRAMFLVTLAVTLERLAPRGDRAARLTGVVAVAIGIAMIVRHASGLSWAPLG